VNRQLAKRDLHVDDLAIDLSNGVKLIALVEILTKVNLTQKWSQRAVLKAHKITNCVLALGHLKENGVSHLTISAENIVDLKEDELNLLLGFCWILLRTFQDVGSGGGKSNSFEAGLLEWLRQMTKEYADIDLTNGFKSNSIQDGKAFLALVNEFKRGLVDYPSFHSENREHNLTTAFQIGEEKLNVPSLIDAAELAAGQTSEKNIVLYLSLWHNAWKELHADVSSADLQKRIAELEEAIRRLMLENEELRNKKQALNLAHGNLSESLHVLTDQTHAVEHARDELSTHLHELRDKYDTEKHNAMEQIKNLSEQIKMSSASSDEQRTQLLNQIAAATKDRDALLEELRKLREGLQMENEDMAKKNQVLGKRLVDLKKSREDLENSLCAKQEREGKKVAALRQKLLQHVNEMHTWKVFLEQDKEYDSEGLHIVMEGVLADLSFREQVVTLDNAIQEETDILLKLLAEKSEDERNPKPVVIGSGVLKQSARRDEGSGQKSSARNNKK